MAENFDKADFEFLICDFAEFFEGCRDLMLEKFAGRSAFLRKAAGDVVGGLDKEMEARLFNFLPGIFPYPVNSEETKHDWPSKSPNFWIFDPIDGSFNFLAGLPIFGSMVGLVRNNQVVFSALYLPVDDLLLGGGLYVAAKGCGAFKMNRSGRIRLRVSQNQNFNEIKLLLEGGSRNFLKNARLRQLIDNCPAEHLQLRICLSAAYSYTRLAAGNCFSAEISALMTHQNKPWDNLPGGLLAAEAGTVVTDWEGNAPSVENSSNWILGNEFVQPHILSLIR